MSAKSRCHDCNHPKGQRTTNYTKSDERNKNAPKVAKKPSCGCKCHNA